MRTNQSNPFLIKDKHRCSVISAIKIKSKIRNPGIKKNPTYSYLFLLQVHAAGLSHWNLENQYSDT